MTQPINDGGMAFPGFCYTDGRGASKANASGEWETYETGMTLRDWFAGQALVGMLSVEPSECCAGDFARQAFEMADAMILQRTKPI